MSTPPQFLESTKWTHDRFSGCHDYVLPVLLPILKSLPAGARILDVGCGNGSVTTEIAKRGYKMVGIDLAEPGIRIARQSCPSGRFELLAADRDVLKNLGEEPFDAVYSLEVIEHLYDPRSFLAGCFAAVKSGGIFACSTPYHGYIKNLALSLANKWDFHANPLFDGGHIKLFSRKKLSEGLLEAGFRDLHFYGTGRLPYLWKSMVMSGVKP
jgi:2-polyprenyl-3-methyl-5-hydroxy-6-metoxy-1,4-benzoquinol methylase